MPYEVQKLITRLEHLHYRVNSENDSGLDLFKSGFQTIMTMVAIRRIVCCVPLENPIGSKIDSGTDPDTTYSRSCEACGNIFLWNVLARLLDYVGNKYKWSKARFPTQRFDCGKAIDVPKSTHDTVG